MDWSFFARKVCLTLGPDWPIATREFERVGLTDVRRFDALDIDGETILGPHQSFSGSVRRILLEFYASQTESLLLLEDDCIFVGEFKEVATALEELPDDWDIVYLGANLLCWNREDDPKPQKYSNRLWRVRQAWTTHCVGFHRKCVPLILETQPPLNEKMMDQHISDLLPQLNAFVTNPMVAYQRPRHSAIWVKPEIDDYTGIFDASQRLFV